MKVTAYPETGADAPGRCCSRAGVIRLGSRHRNAAAGGVPTVRDRGGASVWMLAVGLVLLSAGLAGATVGAAVVARHQAQAAADLGALAGAVRAIDGEPAACERAARFVSANGARLARCHQDGLDVTVTVEVDLPLDLPALRRTAIASARAGPLRADDSR